MKWRLLAAFAGLITVVLLAQDIPLINYLRKIEFERVISSLERDAFLIAGSAEDLLSGEQGVTDPAGLQQQINDYAATNGARVVVVDENGVLVVSTDVRDEPGKDFSNRPEIQIPLEQGIPATGERNSQTLGGNIVYVAVPVVSGTKVVGAVRITFPSQVIDDRTAEKTRGLILVGMISLVGAAFAAFLMSSSFTSPIRRLRRTTEAIAEGDLSQRAEEEGPPEIKGLARSFNTMTERIERLLDQQKAFAGDASHQLRTPLTALRLQLERAADMVDTDPEAARERVEAATEETERLQRLVEGLLMIARSEGSTPVLEPVNVSQLVNDRFEVWEPFAAERGVHLVTNAPPGLIATAVPSSLEQIVDNYVDNALGQARDGDTISIVAAAYANTVGVHVIDEGPGMKPEHLEHAFDRFWRAPDAPHGGSGIGLAVVQHLAELSGGHAVLRNRTDRSGLDACVVLPAAVPLRRPPS
jgi:signal transduction histidine kinase